MSKWWWDSDMISRWFQGKGLIPAWCSQTMLGPSMQCSCQLANSWTFWATHGTWVLFYWRWYYCWWWKSCTTWDVQNSVNSGRLLVNWCRISSINSSIQVNMVDPESVTMANIFTSNRIWLKGINFEEIPPTLLEITFVVRGWFWPSLQYVFFMEDSPRFWMIFRTISFQLSSSGALTS